MESSIIKATHRRSRHGLHLRLGVRCSVDRRALLRGARQVQRPRRAQASASALAQCAPRGARGERAGRARRRAVTGDLRGMQKTAKRAQVAIDINAPKISADHGQRILESLGVAALCCTSHSFGAGAASFPPPPPGMPAKRSPQPEPKLSRSVAARLPRPSRVREPAKLLRTPFRARRGKHFARQKSNTST